MKGCTTRGATTRHGHVAHVGVKAMEERDPARFYCPFPGCNRSFAELWRLKVHFRASPDVRGSGKERGHGQELAHCPKCSEALKPGKHHIRCSGAVKSASRKRSRTATTETGSQLRAKASGGHLPASSVQYPCAAPPPPKRAAVSVRPALVPELGVPEGFPVHVEFGVPHLPDSPLASPAVSDTALPPSRYPAILIDTVMYNDAAPAFEALAPKRPRASDPVSMSGGSVLSSMIYSDVYVTEHRNPGAARAPNPAPPSLVPAPYRAARPAARAAPAHLAAEDALEPSGGGEFPEPTPDMSRGGSRGAYTAGGSRGGASRGGSRGPTRTLALTGASGSAAPPPKFREVVDGPKHDRHVTPPHLAGHDDLAAMIGGPHVMGGPHAMPAPHKRSPAPPELCLDEIEAMFSDSCHEQARQQLCSDECDPGVAHPAHPGLHADLPFMSRCPTQDEINAFLQGFDSPVVDF